MQPPSADEQFLNVLRSYNGTIFPLQEIFIIAALFIFTLLFWNKQTKDKIVIYFLSFFWFWMGIVFQGIYFTEITKAAYAFGILFIIQGIIFFIYGRSPYKMPFQFSKNLYSYVGIFLMLYSLIFYPFLAYYSNHPYPASPTFGLPGPTTIFTFGALLFVSNKISIWILIIPLLWSVIGIGISMNFGIYEDVGLLIAGIVGFGLIIRRNKEISVASA